MTYSVGGIIQAADINSWLTTVNNVYGVGSGDRGYGQSSAQGAVAVGNTINSTQWTGLRYMIAVCAAHQATSAANLVPTNVLDPGDLIYAHIDSTAPNNYNVGTMVTSIDTNRLTGGAAMSLTSGAHTVTRGTSFTATVTTVIDVIFSSENHARYFFNTGGELRIRLTASGALAGSGAAQDADWRDIIANKVGTFTLKARSTSRTGSAGTIQNGGGGGQGFYGLNGTNTTIYNGANIGGTNYTTNDVTIQAQVLNVAGVNGGNGNTIRFTIQASDDHSNGFYDLVSAGLQAQFDHYKVGTTNLTTAIAAPTFSTISGWS